MNRIFLTTVFSIILLSPLFGQTGGEGVYSFLQLTNSPQAAALGGIQVALPDADPGLLLQNPALLSAEMNNNLSANYASYLAGIGFGYGSYARNLGKYGMAAVGIQFANYGQFVAADENGVITGNFGASDYALVLTYAKKIGSLFTLGGSLKPIYSQLENYHSFGIAADLGVVYKNAGQPTTVALCIKDLGTQLTTYYDNGNHEKIVWSLRLGITHKLQHAPLRFSITAYDLNRWNSQVSAADPNGVTTNNGETSPFSMLMRHLSPGAELFPDQKLTLRIGYNYRRHDDLSTTYHTGITGLTAGMGINLSFIRVNYAISGYVAGMVHNFSLTADLSRFTGKQQKL